MDEIIQNDPFRFEFHSKIIWNAIHLVIAGHLVIIFHEINHRLFW